MWIQIYLSLFNWEENQHFVFIFVLQQSLIVSHQWNVIRIVNADNMANHIFKLELFLWAVLGTDLYLIWTLTTLASTEVKKTRKPPAMNLLWDHMLLQKQPYTFAGQRQIPSRQITAARSPALDRLQGKGILRHVRRIRKMTKGGVCNTSWDKPSTAAGFSALPPIKEGRQHDKVTIALDRKLWRLCLRPSSTTEWLCGLGLGL